MVVHTESYIITEKIHNICYYLHSQKIIIKRCQVIKLVKDYIDEEVNKITTWAKNFNPFTNELDNLTNNTVEKQKLIGIYRSNIDPIVDYIKSDLKVDDNSLILTEINANSKGVYLIVENSGDYRIVEYQLRERGAI